MPFVVAVISIIAVLTRGGFLGLVISASTLSALGFPLLIVMTSALMTWIVGHRFAPHEGWANRSSIGVDKFGCFPSVPSRFYFPPARFPRCPGEGGLVFVGTYIQVLVGVEPEVFA